MARGAPETDSAGPARGLQAPPVFEPDLRLKCPASIGRCGGFIPVLGDASLGNSPGFQELSQLRLIRVALDCVEMAEDRHPIGRSTRRNVDHPFFGLGRCDDYLVGPGNDFRGFHEALRDSLNVIFRFRPVVHASLEPQCPPRAKCDPPAPIGANRLPGSAVSIGNVGRK